MLKTMIHFAAATAVATLFAACTNSGEGGREVVITQSNDGCTPARIDATPGEKLKLVVKNESGEDYEVEGIEGTKLEEIVVPSGKTRTPGYKVPGGERGTYKIKCYVPAGPSTIIEIVAGGGAASSDGVTPEPDPEADPEAEEGANDDADDTVRVSLTEYKVTLDKLSVAAGKTRFDAVNESASQVHELAILKKESDGSLENLGEIEDLDPGTDGTIILEMEPGDYVLACLIVPGQEGSTVDHFQEGMQVDFTVD